MQTTIQYNTHSIGETLFQPPSQVDSVPNATSFSLNHSWTAAGRYEVIVTATDNQSTSSSSITVYIDAKQIENAGYLLDNDGDGIYDAFYSDALKQITTVQKNDGNYTIDSDGNGEWDLYI